VNPESRKRIIEAVDRAVSDRAREIRSQWRQKDGDYVYTGHRTGLDNLGWRFRQTFYNGQMTDAEGRAGLGATPYPEMVAEIYTGKHDRLIEATWHDAASAEWYYKYEKDYGRDEEDEYEEWLDEEDEE
jgi:hypothetical protein